MYQELFRSVLLNLFEACTPSSVESFLNFNFFFFLPSHDILYYDQISLISFCITKMNYLKSLF